MSTRLLVTGSRLYPASRTAIVHSVLLPYLAGLTPANAHEYVLVCGMGTPRRDDGDQIASGFDYIASQFWVQLGATLDPFPANWNLGRSGGPRRNAAMVASGADECLGFPWFETGATSSSSGTIMTMNLAHRAGIPTYRIRVDGSRERYTGANPDKVPAVRGNQGMHDLPAL